MDADSLAVGAAVTRSGVASASLVKRASSGDLEAFEQIVRMHERSVVRLALRITGNDGEAKEVAQEVFLKLHRNLGSIDETRGLEPWLYRVAVNAANDVLRKRRPTVAIEDSYAMFSSGGPEAETLAAERRTMFRRAVASLPEKERAALVLRDVEGLTTAQVAGILGMAEGTVRSHISSARVKLRRIVNEMQRRPR